MPRLVAMVDAAKAAAASAPAGAEAPALKLGPIPMLDNPAYGALDHLAVAGFVVLHGVAWGVRGPFMQAMRADYFGRNAIGMIMGLMVEHVIGDPTLAEHWDAVPDIAADLIINGLQTSSS